MSAAVAVPSVSLVDNTQKLTVIYGTIAVSASPATYTAGGIACSFADFDAIKASRQPVSVALQSQPAAGSGVATKYVYQFLPGASQASGLLQIFTGAAAQAGLTELTDGAAIPAGVSGDSIFFTALFNRV